MTNPIIVNFYGGRSSVGRAADCGSVCRGFESHRPPHFKLSIFRDAFFCPFFNYLIPLGSAESTLEKFPKIPQKSQEIAICFYFRLSIPTIRNL